ncbi:LOW QUALITY PROTEIN: actin-like protein 10 [Cariama cristata]
MPKPAVVTDNGSSFTAGLAGQKKSKFVLRTMLLHPCSAGRNWEIQWHPTTAESTAGFAVAPRMYPLKHGITEDMENLTHLFFCGLKAPPEEQPVLVADSPSDPSTNKEKLVEVLFESFGVPALHMANTRFLSLCAYGRVTGLAGASHVTSVCLGQTWREVTYRLRVAGGFFSSYRLLMECPNDPSGPKALNKKTVIQLKKQCCYVSTDYEGDLRDQGYHPPAPDGHWITLDKERFCCLEPLFQLKLLHQSSPRLHHLALQSLQKVPNHASRVTVGNIVLSGGSLMFPGFPKRMCLKLNTLFHGTGCQTQVLVSLERATAAARCSMAASLMSSQHVWMTKTEYQEHDAEYVRKIFQ